MGAAQQTLLEAAQILRRTTGVSGVVMSSVYKSAPVDATGPDFFNAVARVDTSLAPLALLDVLQAIETEFGRRRPYRHAPRTLDLDLLAHADTCVATPRLHLPHPRLHQRAFVLLPLLELWPHAELPGLGRLSAWLASTTDQAIERLPG